MFTNSPIKHPFDLSQVWLLQHSRPPDDIRLSYETICKKSNFLSLAKPGNVLSPMNRDGFEL